MKHSFFFRYVALALAAVTALPLLGCGGCVSHEKKRDGDIGDSRAIEWKLSPEAQTTYAFLLYDQALRQEDEEALVSSLQALSSGQSPVGIYVESGIWLMSRKSPLALRALEIGLRQFPDDSSLNLLYAEALMENDEAAKAIDHMRAYVAKYPDSIDARLELALLLVKHNQYDEAQHLLGSITGKQRTTLVDYYQARALIGMNRSDEAIPYLQRAIKNTPDFLEGMAELAYIYERRKDLREARRIYEKMLQLNDSGQEVLFRLIALSLRLEQPEKAMGFLRKGPATPGFRLTAASMFIEARQYAQAEVLLKEISKSPDAPAEVYFYLAGVAYDGHKDTREALLWLDKIPEDNRFYDRSVLLRVQMLAEEDKLEDALRVARDGQKTSPDRRELWQMEVRLLATLHRTKEALAAADKAVVQWPEDAETAFLRASLLDESGNKKGAMAAMEDLIKRHPEHYQALNYVGYTLAEENRDLDRALLLLRKAMELSPESAYIADSLAWAQYKAGKLEEAWSNIVKATTLRGEPDPAIWEHYGDIAEALGKKDEARRGYTRALEFKPANAPSIRKRLSKL